MAKLKPILFNTEMVQKIMAGKKTETRRVVLPQPEGARFVLDCDEENRTFDLMCGNNGAGGIFRDWAETVKPKFWFGDVLYIRETWRVQSAHRFEADAKIEFRAGGPLGKIQFPGGCSDSESREAFDQFIAKWSTDSKWNPSIFMPKEAARTFLKIVDVSVERLGDINDGGLKAEGIDRNQPYRAMRMDFRDLWNSTISADQLDELGWYANPWVFVYKFQQIPGHRRSELGDYRRSGGRADRWRGTHSLDVPRGRAAGERARSLHQMGPAFRRRERQLAVVEEVLW